MQAEFGSAFDFDDWMELARRDPQQFELARTKAINEACARMESDRRLLAGLRWRIDMERARCRTPLQCCLKLYSMMWDRFLDLDRHFQDSDQIDRGSKKEGKSARIMKLPNPGSN